MAESYSTRPSQLLGVDDPYAAWCIDEVSYTWGMAVDGAVERARHNVDDPQHGNAAASAELERLLREPKDITSDGSAPTTGRFRDPAQDMLSSQARRRSQ